MNAKDLIIDVFNNKISTLGLKQKNIADVKKLGYPVIVKPATLGSSVGITYVKEEKELANAIEEAMKYDVKVVVEKVVKNLVEVNCSVVGNYSYQETSVIEEVTSDEEFLTYADKYIGGSKGKLKVPSKGMASASRIIPARISKELETNIKETSKAAFKALNLGGVCENTCPLTAVKVHCGCYAVVEETLCVGCEKCVKSCPAGCIEMKERAAV